MKKITFVAAMAIAAATFTSCGNSSAPKAELKSDVDTLSYTMGVAQSQQLKGYLTQALGIDSTYLNDFVKGLNEGVNAGDDKKKSAYFAGLQIGQQISQGMIPGMNRQVFGTDSTKTLSTKNFVAGLLTALGGEKALFTTEQAQQMSESLSTSIRAKQFMKNMEAGKKYIAEYAKKEGIQKISVDRVDSMRKEHFKGDIYYKVVKAGTGAVPTANSKVKFDYEGKTIDGNVFDSSIQRKQPVVMQVTQLVPGFTEALLHMPVGSEWEVVIPQELAYGENGSSGIEPYSTLIFTIKLLGIEK